MSTNNGKRGILKGFVIDSKNLVWQRAKVFGRIVLTGTAHLCSVGYPKLALLVYVIRKQNISTLH